MTLEETSNLLDKIKLYRPYFAGHLDKTGLIQLKKEWFDKLESYDTEDINSKLEEFLKDGDNLNKQPDVYQLIKNCKTKKQKQNQSIITSCKFCGRWLEYKDLHEHQDRCRSINYIKRLYLKYFPNREVPLKELYEISNEEFDSNYYKILEIVSSKLTGEEKERVEKLLEMRNL